ncbi:hypothetical protein HED63_27065 [Ochrobactrum cytisi]|nr:hypothetical protein [Brucella cytisi]
MGKTGPPRKPVFHSRYSGRLPTFGVQAGLSARLRRWLYSATVGLGLCLGQMTVMMAFMNLIAVARR